MTYLDLFYIALGFGLGNLFYHFIGPNTWLQHYENKKRKSKET